VGGGEGGGITEADTSQKSGANFIKYTVGTYAHIQPIFESIVYYPSYIANEARSAR
jgi:hypothetical protein